ncbi:MAG: cytochrome c family protein [Alphaproteobacteria bacterium]|nr:cytochrome c family protein [Alphaproteobacteria bacterium]MDP7190390.1 cytochrome c family protein [Alphaproteobacteria bacterium]HJO88349.1 cytochrome c family protein [Alphaproteobacteria bacterium]
MHGKELYKVYGVILVILLLVTTLWVLGDNVLAPEELKENIYMPGRKAGGVGMGEDAGKALDPAQADGDGAVFESPGDSVTVLLADADAGAGRKLAKKCSPCHSLEQEGKKKIGPALRNIVGAKKGRREGFPYSKGLAEKGGTWTHSDLDAFLTTPKIFVPGTKMMFSGVKNPQDRANLILYLHSLSDKPKSPP